MVLTWGELLELEGQIERWIRFGAVVEERIVDRRPLLVEPRRGAVYALFRWRNDGHGTVDPTIAIPREVSGAAAFNTHQTVLPGAKVVVRLRGWALVRTVLEAIDAVESSGFRMATVSPDHWRTVGARIGIGLPPGPYDRTRNRAWRLRQSAGR